MTPARPRCRLRLRDYRRLRRSKIGLRPTAVSICRRTIWRRSSICAATPSGAAATTRSRLKSRIVAKAFVALAHYYLAGIPNSPVEPDPARARNLLIYAATYFRDADAQYHLGRLFLEGVDAPPDPMAAARWLSLAADKDHHRAQALLGRMLFAGEGLPRQAALGLMFLMLASEGPTAEEAWIGDLFAAAFKQASVEEQAQALVLLERRLKRNGDSRRARAVRPAPLRHAALTPSSGAAIAATRSRGRSPRDRCR